MRQADRSLNPESQELIREGESIIEQLDSYFGSWPKAKGKTKFLMWSDCDQYFKKRTDALIVRLTRWVNKVYQLLQNSVVFGKEYFSGKLQKGMELVKGTSYTSDGAPITLDPKGCREKAVAGIDDVITLLTSVPHLDSYPATVVNCGSNPISARGNTAFILMRIDRSRHELEDLMRCFKEAFQEFGISAYRADDIEHSGVITEAVLEYIRNSEFLIADLTDQRPNVYYEVGYAHAIGKRPILYRKEGTPLHFDLSVHNVPEYRNLTELKGLLRKRLEAITGRHPERDRPYGE